MKVPDALHPSHPDGRGEHKPTVAPSATSKPEPECDVTVEQGSNAAGDAPQQELLALKPITDFQARLEETLLKLTYQFQTILLELLHQQGCGGTLNVADHLLHRFRIHFKKALKKGGVLL